MPVTWDDATERQFLLAFIHVANPDTPSWAKVAEVLNASGGSEFNGNALRQKYAKMKKAAEVQFGAASDDGEGDGAEVLLKTPSRPRGKKAGSEMSVKKSTGKRSKTTKKLDDDGGSKGDGEEDEEDEEDELASPSKKVKREPGIQSEDEDALF